MLSDLGSYQALRIQRQGKAAYSQEREGAVRTWRQGLRLVKLPTPDKGARAGLFPGNRRLLLLTRSRKLSRKRREGRASGVADRSAAPADVALVFPLFDSLLFGTRLERNSGSVQPEDRGGREFGVR